MGYARHRRVTRAAFLAVLALAVWCCGAHANNIAVSGITLTEQNTADGTCKVEFDITWDNSWRTFNYDAAWVFVKYSTDSGATWYHGKLKESGTNPAGVYQGTGTGLDIVVPDDKMGAFLQRSSSGSGTVDTQDVRIVWDWGTDGLSPGDTARVKVFAIETVSCPAGNYFAGDGSSAGTLRQYDSSHPQQISIIPVIV